MSTMEGHSAGKADAIELHEHVLTPFQKLVCLVELLFMVWLTGWCCLVIVSHVKHVLHLFHL